MKFHDLKLEVDGHILVHSCTQQLGDFLWKARTSGIRAAEQNVQNSSACCRCRDRHHVKHPGFQDTVALGIYWLGPVFRINSLGFAVLVYLEAGTLYERVGSRLCV